MVKAAEKTRPERPREIVSDNTGDQRWRAISKRMARKTEIGRRSAPGLVALLAIVIITVLLAAASTATAAEAAWKVGRGHVTGPGRAGGTTLEVSLRNTGSVSAEEVRILGRWTTRGAGPGSIGERDLASLAELGVFTRETRMKQTAIVEMLLDPLGPAPAGGHNIEIAVVTGGRLTDSTVIAAEQ